MGDVGRGFFVAPGIPEFLRDEVIPVADVVTPNQFELEFLTGRRIATLEDLLAAADALRDQGPSTVLVTSAVYDGHDQHGRGLGRRGLGGADPPAGADVRWFR